MTTMKRWRVGVLLGEDEGRASAEARLQTEVGDHLVGIGRAKLNPHDGDPADALTPWGLVRRD